jgi:bacterioferritin-associated ferredoxin
LTFPAAEISTLICQIRKFLKIHSGMKPELSLESLQNAVFPFATCGTLQYRRGPASKASPDGPAGLMIVCSCNVLSDRDVRSAVESAQDLPRSAKQIYGCLGCSAECGRCARTIKTIINDALGACARACGPGCPHSQAGEYETLDDVFADEAAEPLPIEA